MKDNLAVVHLIRHSNNIEHLKAFIKSYHKNKAGLEHTLVLIFKGFSSEKVSQEYMNVLSQTKFIAMYLDDNMFDLDTYFTVARETNFNTYMFLNSFSIILAENWLKLMVSRLNGNVGLVGATGSWQRLYDVNRLKVMNIREKVHFLLQARYRLFFPPFPNCHIRTNAFLIKKSIIDKIKFPTIRNKFDAHRFESGYKSLTRQVIKLGFKPVIVGRDGYAYECKDWKISGVFRSKGQENLLVEDNQTKAWEIADESRKKLIESVTWGT